MPLDLWILYRKESEMISVYVEKRILLFILCNIRQSNKTV